MFRPEVMEGKRESFAGPAAIAVPVSWQIFGGFLFFIVLAIAILISTLSFSRVENASGIIIPDKGVVPIIAMREGIISEVYIEDGQSVKAGSQLLQLRANDGSADSALVQRIDEAMERQSSSLEAQRQAATATSIAQLRQLGALEISLAAEVAQIEGQMALQRDLIDTAERDFEKASSVAERGFISARDMQDRKERLLTRRQDMAQLRQSLAAKKAALEGVKRDAQAARAQAQSTTSSISANQAQLDRQIADVAATRSITLKAPVDGIVTALTARQGQTVTPVNPLLTLIPANSVLRAELFVPTSAIGFIKRGQSVSLAIDAFPYQQFGTVKGMVSTVASSPISRQMSSGETISVYPVAVEIDRPSIDAFGREEPLLPGMSLQARIIAERQTLLEWLFEPLFAVSQR